MSPLRKKINEMQMSADKPPAEPLPEEATGEEPVTGTESLEDIQAETEGLLDKAASAGALAPLEPYVEQCGCSDAKDLLKRAQSIPELKGKPPGEVASMLGSDPALLEKLGGKGTASEDKAEKETENMGGTPKERFLGSINKLRARE